MTVLEPQERVAEIVPELEEKLDELLLMLSRSAELLPGQGRVEHELYVKQICSEIAEVTNRMTALMGRPPVRF